MTEARIAQEVPTECETCGAAAVNVAKHSRWHDMDIAAEVKVADKRWHRRRHVRD